MEKQGKSFVATIPRNEAILTTGPPWCALSNSSASSDIQDNNQPSPPAGTIRPPLHKHARGESGSGPRAMGQGSWGGQQVEREHLPLLTRPKRPWVDVVSTTWLDGGT